MGYVRFFIDRLLRRDTVLTREFQGRPFRLSVVARREIRRAGELGHETALIERILAHLQEGDVFYDAGANIGAISLLTALHPAGASLRIHAFEPEPGNFNQLRRNIGLNGLSDRVIPHPLALGASVGEAELYVRGTAGEGRHSMAEARGSTGSIRIPVSTAAAFARESGEPPDIVKIDVEGAEGQVLSGMTDLLRERKPRELFMEIHSKGDGDRMPDGGRIHDRLAALGYTLAWDRPRRSGRHCHYRAPQA